MIRWEYCTVLNTRKIWTDSCGQQKHLFELELVMMGTGQSAEFSSLGAVYYELGRNGWELVSITQENISTGLFECHYFKRPLTEE